MCLESLTPGTLVSGKRNIENRVRSISVLDAVNGKEAESLKGIKEQILLTSFKHVKKEAEKENIIKVLSKKGAAALVVFNQQNSTSQISKNLACFSENIGFPLIDIPAENPSNYSNVIEEVMDKLDILYMTRVQRERFFNEADYVRLKDTYILDNKKLKTAKDDMIILHPLPRVNEIATEVDSDHRAKYFNQVKFGMIIRMALILKLLEVK